MLDALKKTKHHFLVLAASSHGLFLLQMTCSQKQGLSPSLEQKWTPCLISDQREWLSCKDGPYTNWEELLSAGKISSRKFLSSGEGMETKWVFITQRLKGQSYITIDIFFKKIQKWSISWFMPLLGAGNIFALLLFFMNKWINKTVSWINKINNHLPC